MGGTINAQSEPGRGSTFHFELELSAPLAAEALPVHASEAFTAQASWTTPPLVLVAEDNQINQIVAARTLERCGCRVVVGDGQEALQTLETQHYDAVLMDCQMPNMDGYQATAELRRREHGARHTPVIAMTAHAMDGDRERCLQAGMDDYISKPMSSKSLRASLERWIPVADPEGSSPSVALRGANESRSNASRLTAGQSA